MLCRNNVPMTGLELVAHVGAVIAVGVAAGAVTGAVAQFLRS